MGFEIVRERSVRRRKCEGKDLVLKEKETRSRL